MAERATARVTRMLGIVSFLEANGDTPFDQLADQFGVTQDQIRHDVATLWVSGLPGYMHNDLLDFDADLFEEGIARLTQGQGVTQVRPSARETVALIGALESLNASGAAPAALESLLAKLRASLGGSVVSAEEPAPLREDVMNALRSGVSRARVMSLDYVDAKDQRSQRDVEPHRIVSIGGIAYLECFCRKADGYRTLRVDRILAAEVRDEPVLTAPSDEIGFTLEPAYQARVVLAPSARWAIEDLPGVKLTAAGDDFLAEFGVADTDYVAGRLLTIAPYLRSLEPETLRDALAARARAVLAAQA